jgi:peptidyl-prolyl cis-trans isomerase B (cyclophilin B)
MRRMALLLIVSLAIAAGCDPAAGPAVPSDPVVDSPPADEAPGDQPPTETPVPVNDTPIAEAADIIPIVIETSMGTIHAELWADRAPETVENFLAYVDDGFFDGTIFHRVIPGFMIQGGGFLPQFVRKDTMAPIRNEARRDVLNTRGTLAMARTSQVHSATSQFFINVADNDFLNYRSATPDGYGYCVFGTVTDDASMAVVDAIVAVRTTTVRAPNGQPMQDVPANDVTIESIRRADEPARDMTP